MARAALAVAMLALCVAPGGTGYGLVSVGKAVNGFAGCTFGGFAVAD